jgi:hypothetical protein
VAGRLADALHHVGALCPNFSVADPGSGAVLTPGSRMGNKSRSGSGMNITDHISESLETIFLGGVKILEFFDADPDPGSGNLFDIRSGVRDGKNSIRNKRIRNTA